MRGIRDKRTFFFQIHCLHSFCFVSFWFGLVVCNNIYDGDILFYEGLLVCVCPL